LFEIGYIVRAHGVKGELRVECHAESPDLLRDEVYLPEPRRILESRRAHGVLLLRLEGVESREEAEALRGRPLRIPRARLPELPPGEFYLGDLPGLRVWTQEEGQAEPAYLGVLDRVEVAAGQELWHIVTPGGREALFPAVGELVRELDPKAGRTVICPPPGLLDLYLHED